MRTIPGYFTAPLLALLAAAGCSSSAGLEGDSGAPDADADTDADTDADADTDTGDGFPWDWGCGIVLDTTCDDFEAAPSAYADRMLDLEALGVTGIRAGSATAILAEREDADGIAPVVLVWHAWEETAVEVGVIDPPDEQLRAIDIASRRDLFYGDDGLEPVDADLGYAAFALLCAETWCGLWGLAVDEANEPVGLEALPEGEVPLADARAVVYVPHWGEDIEELPSHLCVAGKGVACYFPGTAWHEPVGELGPTWNAAAVSIPTGYGFPTVWVAGEDGRVASDADFVTGIDTGTAIPFTSISVEDGIWAAGGDGGFVFGDADGHLVDCSNDEVDYGAVFVHPSYETWSGIGVSALSTEHVFEVWERSDTEPGSCVGATGYLGEPRDAGLWPFGADVAFGYALTRRGLYLRTEYAGLESK